MPKIKNLKIDEEATLKIRESMKKSKKIKITVNLDEETLLELKKRSIDTGIPYQTLLNRLLKEVLDKGDNKHTYSYRLNKLEKEVAQLKKKLSA